jgi:hypothetical protein
MASPDCVMATMATDRLTLMAYRFARPRNDISVNVCRDPQHA